TRDLSAGTDPTDTRRDRPAGAASSRGPATRRSRAAARSRARAPLLLLEEVEELLHDPRRRPPHDIVGRDLVEVDLVLLPAARPGLGAEDGGVGERGERHLDDALDLVTVGHELHALAHDPDDRRDDELGRPGFRVVEQAEDLDRRRRQTDLLRRLA